MQDLGTRPSVQDQDQKKDWSFKIKIECALPRQKERRSCMTKTKRNIRDARQRPKDKLEWQNQD